MAEWTERVELYLKRRLLIYKKNERIGGIR
jgi:hypothetical protein